MYTYLKSREYYEERYDDATVSKCRSGESLVNETFTTMEKKLGKKELTDRLTGWYLHYSQYYFLFVESAAAERAANRGATIAKWMAEDQKKDERLASAHIAGGTFCRACGKDMKVVSKDYLHRDNHKEDNILIMFECEACNKRRALWEDDTEWEGAKRECEKCGSKTISKHTKKQDIITWTETCEKCGHIKTETLDLSDTESEPEPVDPYLELDRKRFIFGSDMMFRYDQKLKHFERLANLNASVEDKVQHADVYDGIKQVKKLKIAQLKELLEPVFTKNGYSDFKLGDPQLGREVTLSFNCLDTKDDREEYQSKKTLHKAIEKVLEDTNWRVMSAGVSYRLGFLSGSLRAYESEEDLKKLVEQRIKKGYVPKVEPKEPTQQTEKPSTQQNARNMRESVQVYFDKLMLGSVPAEVTLKSGKVKKTSIPVLSGEMNPLLRVFVPMREGDTSVPKFIRDFDFKFGDKNKVPKVQKDSQGREIRRI